MRRNLAPGGLLMFDVNTLQTYRSFFAEEEVVERDGRRLIWRGQGSDDVAPGTISEASFEVEETGESGGPPTRLENHRQRHFPEAEVLAALERVGLECLDVFGHGFDAVLKQPLRELVHSKAVYMARPRRAPSLGR